MNREQYTLSPDENRRVFAEVITPALYSSLTSVDQPVASFFRGQPGAGKSVLQSQVISTLQEHSGSGSVMEIDIDAFRSFHPHYSDLQRADEASAAFYTDLDCGSWTEHAVALSMDTRTHVTLEGTLRNEAPTLQTAHQYTERGVHSDLYLLAVHELTSRSRIFQRYIQQLRINGGNGRYTIPEAHGASYSALPETAERTVASGLFRHVHIVDKHGSIIESFNGDKQSAASKATAAITRARRLTPADIDEIRDLLQDLEPAIQNQPNEIIRRDFDMLVDMVRQQSRQTLGGVALVYAQMHD